MLHVIGVGNRFRTDDGVGLALVERLSVSGADVAIHLWEQHDALALVNDALELDGELLIVDCADMGLKPGEWRLFSDSNVRLGRDGDALSTHGVGLAEAIALLRHLDFNHSIHLFGVQPSNLSQGNHLSELIAERLDSMSGALQRAVESMVMPMENINECP